MTLDAAVREIQAKDGVRSGITVYGPARETTAPVMICTPAMGVPATYYQPLAEALSLRGVIVVTADLRGVGLSSVRARRGVDFGYHEIIAFDLPAVVDEVRTMFPGRPVFLLGHSLGGQLNCLYASTRPEGLSGLVLVAAQSVYYKGWPFPRSIGVFFFEHFVRIVANTMGYFPGRFFRFGHREARRLIRDWAHQGLTGRYHVPESPLDFEELLMGLELPILAISFTDDLYGPASAVSRLLSKMTRSRTTRVQLSPADLGVERLGHFGWMKQAELVAAGIATWINETCKGPEAP